MYEFKFIDNGVGEIQIDNFRESFQSDLSFWTANRYIAQWEDAKRHLANDLPTMFITSITDPSTASFIRSWVCYPIGDELIFQEHIIFLDDLGEPFDLKSPHKHVGPYENFSEDGERISEWRTEKD